MRVLLISLLSFILLTVAAPVSVVAQQTDSSSKIVSDPIVETLDSLVKLNNVLRFNTINPRASGVTSDRSVPVYSDDVYRSRFARMNSPIPMVYNEQVKSYIDLYAYRKRNLTSRVLGLADLYFPLFEEMLDKEGLPLEFKYLAIVESALNPGAVSKVGATGLWQFMYGTAKLYGLKVNSYIDERRDIVASTEAEIGRAHV